MLLNTFISLWLFCSFILIHLESKVAVLYKLQSWRHVEFQTRTPFEQSKVFLSTYKPLCFFTCKSISHHSTNKKPRKARTIKNNRKCIIISCFFPQCLPVPVLILYRACFALYGISWITYRIFKDESFFQVKTLFKATNWAYSCLIVYFILSSTTTVLHYLQHKQEKSLIFIKVKGNHDENQIADEIAWFHKIQWLFYNIASTMAVGVTIYYWTFEYNGRGVSLSDVNVHLLNSVFMILEHILSSMPWHLAHVVYSIMFALLYTKATLFYWVWINKEPIYRVLDYSEKPGLAACLYLFVVLPFIQLFLCAILRLRESFGRRTKKSNELKEKSGIKVHIV